MKEFIPSALAFSGVIFGLELLTGIASKDPSSLVYVPVGFAVVILRGVRNNSLQKDDKDFGPARDIGGCNIRWVDRGNKFGIGSLDD